MEPIPVVSLGASPASYGLQLGAPSRGVSSIRSAETPRESTGAIEPSNGNNEMTELISLLQSMDGGENSQLVRLLIGLMILLALLKQIDGTAPQTASPSRASGSEFGEGVGLWMQTTSTSISLEQSSTTIVIGDAANAFGAPAPGLQSLGGQLDYSA